MRPLRQCLWTFLCALLYIGLCAELWAQPTADKAREQNEASSAKQDVPDPLDSLLDEVSAKGNSRTDTRITIPSNNAIKLDETTRQAYLEAWRDIYRSTKTNLDHRRNSFEWQLLSSKVLFFTVIFLVLSGMYLSWMQFNLAKKQVLQNAMQPAAKDVESQSSVEQPATNDKESQVEHEFERFAETTLKASREGVELKSSILGVVILLISLLFFYLYLIRVYPITEMKVGG